MTLGKFNYVRQGGYVIMPFVCLSVCFFLCLLATLRKNYWTDLRENFTTDVSVHGEELIKFWESSASGSGYRNFLKESSTLWDRAFFRNLAHIFGKNWYDLYEDFLTNVALGREISVKFWKSPESVVSGPHRLGRGLRSPSALVQFCDVIREVHWARMQTEFSTRV